jgi:hypothetical protein
VSRVTPQVVALALLFAVGCGGKPEPTVPSTGGRETVEEFYGALIANEPPRAYAVLDAESQRRVSANQFVTLVNAYRQNVGFTAERCNIRSCEEQGDSAIAHVTLSGHSSGHSRRYNDGITLRRGEGRWGVVLPANFGQKAH